MIETLQPIWNGFWMTLSEMAPYLLFGFFVAGLLSGFVAPRLIEKHLGGGGFWPLVKASAFGVPLPLCSCGVLPVSMSLYKHGASRGSTISFLLSTPQTGVDSIMVTYSLLGPVIAIFRPLAAFITGVLGGSAVDIIDRQNHLEHEHKKEHCHDSCCDPHNQQSRFVRGLHYGFVSLPRDIGGAMLIGLFVAALITALIPEGFFAEYLGTGFLAMVVMMVLGIPVYVCATASVPIAAALILKGVTPGAALVFLMTGPVTNAASFATIWKSLGTRTAITYLVSAAGCALLSGLALDFVAQFFAINVATAHSHMIPSPLKHVSAILLLVLLIYGMISARKHKRH